MLLKRYAENKFIKVSVFQFLIEIGKFKYIKCFKFHNMKMIIVNNILT